MTVSCDVPVKALYETGYKYELENENGNIYVIDEDFSALKSKEFAAAVLKLQNCFILITRESLPGIPYSYKEIYHIKTSGKFHFLERTYPDYEVFEDKEKMITEVELVLERPEEVVDTNYASIEQYCADLLTDITRNTEAQYAKSKLNECYVNNCCCKGKRCQFFTREKK